MQKELTLQPLVSCNKYFGSDYVHRETVMTSDSLQLNLAILIALFLCR